MMQSSIPHSLYFTIAVQYNELTDAPRVLASPTLISMGGVPEGNASPASTSSTARAVCYRGLMFCTPPNLSGLLL